MSRARKKARQKKKHGQANTDEIAEDLGPKMSRKEAQHEVLKALYGIKEEKEKEKEHKFWSTQPVPQLDEVPSKHGPIEEKTLEDVRKEPYPINPAFEWCDVDIADAKQLQEVYDLLTKNYVEDEDNMFRFDYSPNFLRWALTAPGYLKTLHVGVRVKKNKKLVGFISGIPVRMRVYDHIMAMVEINFLCVHKKLRSKRIAPTLIKEVTRRTNMLGVWQAVYTAGVVLPKPVARNRYYHRSLNPKKLLEVGFSGMRRNMTLARTIKLYRVPKQTAVKGLIEMKEEHTEQACALLNQYLRKFKLVQQYSLEEFRHWFLSREQVIYSYVVVSEAGKVTDLISFYALNSSIIRTDTQYRTLHAAYSFYNVATSIPWATLMQDALVLAHKAGFDVFNALNVMENDTFLKPLKFGIGDGNLQYYVFNWACPPLEPCDVGLVLL